MGYESRSPELQWSAQSRPISLGTKTCWYHRADTLTLDLTFRENQIFWIPSKDMMKTIWHILKISATGMIDIEPFLAFYQSSLRLWHQKMTNFGLSGISDFMRNHGNMLSMGGFRNRSQSYTFERMRMSIVKCGNQTKLWDSWTVQFYLLKIQQNWVKM